MAIRRGVSVIIRNERKIFIVMAAQFNQSIGAIVK
jgi:hypothetical protein